jgi:ankyrin repeat protein
MLLEIEEESRPDAIKLLRWLAYGRGLPSLDELVEVLVINLDGDGSVYSTDRPGLEDILEILRGLVIVLTPEDVRESKNPLNNEYNGAFRETGRDRLVRLAHFSIKEYLESDRILRSRARESHLESAPGNAVIAQSCLVYLSHYNSSEHNHDGRDFNNFPLLQYAAESWPHHVARQGTNSVARVAEFLHNKKSLLGWLALLAPHREDYWPFEYDGLDTWQAGGLYYATFLNLPRLIAELLALGEGVNVEGGLYNTALQAASYNGENEAVKMLLNTGADVNAQEGYHVTVNALQAASYRGKEEIVQTLLQAGADVNAQGGHFGNALQAASYIPKKETVQTLLDAGADINAQGGKYSNALQAASCTGEKEMVQTLLDAGADVNFLGGEFGSALGAASSLGWKDIAQMLLAAGALRQLVWRGTSRSTDIGIVQGSC